MGTAEADRHHPPDVFRRHGRLHCLVHERRSAAAARSAAASSPSEPRANLALFEYVDGFDNSRRIQKRLGYLGPIKFEEQYYADRATAEQANLSIQQPALTS
ncbi:IS3 family transposase [Streptomyces sp. NPDC002206]